MSSSKRKAQEPTTPSNRGRIIVEHNNTETLRFWIRVFELEPQIAFAQAKFNENRNDQDQSPVWAIVPIISEYHAGHIKWIYVLILEIDTLGVCGGSGVIYFADKASEEQVRKWRDRFADMVLKTAMERTATGALTELYLDQPGIQD